MNEIEQNHLYTIKSKILEIKNEISDNEKILMLCKDSIIKENEKLRITKQTAIDEIRIIKSDLNNIIQNYTIKQNNFNELNKEYNNLIDKIKYKKQDSELILTNIYKNIEEENRKQSNLKANIYQINIEIEELNNKKVFIENEYNKIHENYINECNNYNNYDNEIKRKMKLLEKNNNSLEKKERELKSKISTLHSEEVSCVL